jgi:eukaryotic-like serine/threonine-protein kinase
MAQYSNCVPEPNNLASGRIIALADSLLHIAQISDTAPVRELLFYQHAPVFVFYFPGTPMPPVPSVESGSYRPYTKTVGAEPLPGYRLLEALGRGGFGEVWKCEAPGGLHKAIKFVPGAGAEDGRGEQRLSQELDAFQQIKAIRHPFLLTLERVEMIDGELVMVMELADRQLLDRFRECRTCGLPGIPRDELLAYFADAAEALDMIAAKHGLQHLDVKPANLFLVAGHVKVGDYGLVARLDPDGPASGHRGLTPKYVAPEALRGEPSNRSDQYSLALVYQELLTGTFPYPGRTPQQIMLQHVSSSPDLTPLPPVDQPILAQALAKKPEERFSSCLGFIQSLMAVASATSLPGAGMDMRRARVERSRVEMELPTAEAIDSEDPTGGRAGAEATENFTLSSVPNVTTPGSNDPLPKLVSTTHRPPATPAPKPVVTTPAPWSLVNTPAPRPQAPLSTYVEPLASTPGRRFAVVLNPIRSIVPVSRLIGVESQERTLSASDFVKAVVEHAANGAHISQMPGDLGQLADGTWVCQFPSTVPSTVLPIKLSVLREQWGVSIEVGDANRVVLRRAVGPKGFWGSLSGKKSAGFEVSIRLPPPGRMVGEMTVTGRVFGTPDRDFAQQAQDAIPKLIMEIRRELKNVDDRRKHARVAAGFTAALYPIHSDGGIDAPIRGRCRDVSLGGLCVVTATPSPTKYVYATFDGIDATSEYAILVRLVRMPTVNRECFCGGQYRMDL